MQNPYEIDMKIIIDKPIELNVKRKGVSLENFVEKILKVYNCQDLISKPNKKRKR